MGEDIEITIGKRIKKILARFLPVPARTFHAEIQEITQTYNRDITEIKDILYNLSNSTTDIQLTLREIQINTLATRKKTDEIIWAEIFNNTVDNSTWLNNISLSPGRWAAGYAYLYIIFRVLRDAKPNRILELGLGESTRIISQYSSAHKESEHIIVESDPEWISFFSKTIHMSDNSNIVHLPLLYQSYKESESVRGYKDFSSNLSNGKYDFICIDGPFGADMKEYARIDALSLLPEHLADSFVILVDDYNRVPEQKMVEDLLLLLENAKISYCKGVYKGEKNTLLICSNDLKFLASL